MDADVNMNHPTPTPYLMPYTLYKDERTRTEPWNHHSGGNDGLQNKMCSICEELMVCKKESVKVPVADRSSAVGCFGPRKTAPVTALVCRRTRLGTRHGM